MGIKWHLGVLRLGAPAFPSDTGARLASRAVFRCFQREFKRTSIRCISFCQLEAKKHTCKNILKIQRHRGISSNRPCGLPLCNSQLPLWMPTKLNGDKKAPGCFAAGRSCLSVGHWLRLKAGLTEGFQPELERTSISCIGFRQLEAKQKNNQTRQGLPLCNSQTFTLDANEIEWG